MKKIILSALFTAIIGSVIFISCKPKNDSDAITPKFKTDDPNGTGNNPQTTNVTTTGTINTTSTQQNSAINQAGTGSSWSYTGCQAGQTCFTINNTSTNTSIELCFLSTPVSGTYQLVGPTALTNNTACMKVTNPPSQDAGSVWYSYAGGSVTVVAPPSGSVTPYICTFNAIPCYKTQGSFYSVTVSGQVGCQ